MIMVMMKIKITVLSSVHIYINTNEIICEHFNKNIDPKNFNKNFCKCTKNI